MSKFFKHKKILLFLLLITVFGIVIFNNKSKLNFLTNSGKEVSEYNEVQEGDSKINGTEFVTFDSFFLRDTDGDSKAESYRGSKIELGKTDKLYFELKVLGEVTLKDAVITFDNSNVRVSGTVAKSTIVPKTLSSTDYKTIELADVGNGTTSLFYLDVVPYLDNDLTGYKGTNKVILTGTVVDNITKEETKISKEIEYDIDSYASKINASIASTNDSNEVNTANVTYEITVQETGNATPLKSAHLTGSVSDFNGVHPSKVVVTSADGTSIDFKYDKDTQKFTAVKNAVMDNKVITSQAYNTKNGNIRYNKWIVYVEYPCDENQIEHAVSSINIDAWYTGYANDSLEEIKSNVIHKIISHETNIVRGTSPGFYDGTEILIGDYVSSIKGYFVDKTPLEDVYLGTSDSNFSFKESWKINSIIDPNNKGYVKYKETGNRLGTNKYITEYVTYKKVQLNTSNMKFPTNGTITILNAETEEVLFVLNKDNWDTELEFPDDVHKLQIITSELDKGKLIEFSINFIKEIDSKRLSKDIDIVTFSTYGNISNGLNVTQVKGSEETNIVPEYGSASFTEAYSSVSIETDKTSYEREISDTSIPMKLTIIHNTVDLANKAWNEGYYLIKLPKEIIGVENLDIQTSFNVISTEVIEINNQRFIKLLTKNKSVVNNNNIVINMDAIVNPKGTTTNEKVELYAINKTSTLYTTDAKDIYDLDGDGNAEEKIGYTSSTFSLVMPTELLTGTIIKDYDDKKSETISPLIADVDPTNNDSDATVEVFLLNNSQNKIKGITLVGKIAYKGNTYQIGKGELGSEYDVEMAGPINIPESLKGKVTVYYSENKTPSSDINDSSNNWKKDVTDYSKIKTYLIKIDESVVMNIKDEYSFTYPIKMPNTTDNLLKKTYFTHGVYFKYVTDAGTYDSQVSGSKLGVRMARKYDLHINTYKRYSNNKITSGVYLLIDEDNNTKTISIDSEGNAIAKGLYVGKKYSLKQHSLPNTYIIDNETKTFIINNVQNDNLELTRTGTYRNIKYNENNVLNIDIENEVLYTLDLHNIDITSEDGIKNSVFKVTGKNHEDGTNILTDSDGHAYLKDMVIGEVYKIEQVKVDNYANTSSFNIKLVRDTNTNEVKIAIEKETSTGEIEFTPVEEKEKVNPKDNPYVYQELTNYSVNADTNPILKVKVTNKNIEKFTLELNKVSSEDEKALKGAQFKITGPGLPTSGRYITTDENGIGSIDLYLSYTGNIDLISGLNDENYPKVNIYKLEEVTAPIGYSLDSKPIYFKGNADIKESDNYEYSIIYDESKSTKKFASDEYDEERKVFKVVVKNYPLVNITKTDEETGEVLPNTYYVINEIITENGVEKLSPAKDANGNYVGEKLIINDEECYVIRTDSEGKITLSLAKGNYQLREIQAADEKYEISDEVIYFSVGQSVPYKAAGVDFIGGYAINNSLKYSNDSYYPDVYRTSDNGYIVITNYRSNKFNVVKYDSNFIEKWTYQILNLQDVHEYTTYFDDLNRKENESTYEASDYSQKRKVIFKETEDGYFFAASSIGIAKLEKETGNEIFTGKKMYLREKIYVYTALCDKVPGAYYSNLQLKKDDPNHYYCDQREYDLNYFPDNGNVIYDFSDENGITMLAPVSSGVRLHDGNVVVSDVSNEYYIIKSDLDGNVLSATPVLKKLQDAQEQYAKENNITDYYNKIGTFDLMSVMIKALSDGSTIVLTRDFISRINNEGEVVHFTPIGYNGWQLSVDYSNNHQLPIYIDDDGNVYVAATNMTAHGIKGTYSAYHDIPKLAKDLPAEGKYPNGFYAAAINKYDKDGNLVDVIEIKRQALNLNFADSNDSKRVLANMNSQYMDFIKVEGGFVIVSGYTSPGEGYNKVELASGEIITIPNSTSFIVYKVNDDSSVEWLKAYTGTYTRELGFISVELHGENEFTVLNSSTSMKIIEEGNENLPPIIQGDNPSQIVILNFKLNDEVTPESPESFELELTNKRKKYNINVSSNEGGKFEVKNKEDEIIYEGTKPGTVETVKHGDDTENTIKIIPDNGYNVTSVTVNGEPAKFTINEDGTVIVDGFKDVTEEKNIVVKFELGSSRVVVHHYLKNTKVKIANDEILTGEINSDYTTIPKTSKLYSLIKDKSGDYVLPNNYKGKYTTKPIEVTYYYDVNEVKLVVNYYLKDTEQSLAPSLIEMHNLGTEYFTKALDIKYYRVVGVVGNPNGTLTDELTEVTYYYEKKELSHLKVRYVDKDTNEDLVQPIEEDIEMYSYYETEQLKEVPKGYKYVSRTNNAVGQATEENIEVIYYYEKIKENSNSNPTSNDKDVLSGTENPETLDGILKYSIMFIVSICGLLLVLKMKKRLYH